MYKVKIQFLDLKKMYNSGQCFSWTKHDDNTYSIVDGDNYVRVKQIDSDQFEFSCSEEMFNDYWYNYFDMDTNYEKIYRSCSTKALYDISENSFLLDSLCYGYGIRVLRQDPWQTMVTFMISQNNNMKRIRKSVDMLREKYGTTMTTNCGFYNAFPLPLQLINADWESCGVGYRAEYLNDLVDYFDGMIDSNIFINDMNMLPTLNLEALLLEFKGMGKKVVNCIMLYSDFHRLECAPIDTHMKKIINTYFDGVNPLANFKGYAGLAQQWMFDYETNKE